MSYRTVCNMTEKINKDCKSAFWLLLAHSTGVCTSKWSSIVIQLKDDYMNKESSWYKNVREKVRVTGGDIIHGS